MNALEYFYFFVALTLVVSICTHTENKETLWPEVRTAACFLKTHSKCLSVTEVHERLDNNERLCSSILWLAERVPYRAPPHCGHISHACVAEGLIQIKDGRSFYSQMCANYELSMIYCKNFNMCLLPSNAIEALQG